MTIKDNASVVGLLIWNLKYLFFCPCNNKNYFHHQPHSNNEYHQYHHHHHHGHQGCIFRLTCSYPELTKDHVLTSAYVNIFRTATRNALNKSVWRKKDCFWLPLNKHTMNIFIQISNSPRTRARFSENQSAPRLENRKTSPCSPCAPNLLHVRVSRILGYHNLCSPGHTLS